MLEQRKTLTEASVESFRASQLGVPSFSLRFCDGLSGGKGRRCYVRCVGMVVDPLLRLASVGSGGRGGERGAQ